jgi:hypothetical protein
VVGANDGGGTDGSCGDGGKEEEEGKMVEASLIKAGLTVEEASIVRHWRTVPHTDDSETMTKADATATADTATADTATATADKKQGDNNATEDATAATPESKDEEVEKKRVKAAVHLQALVRCC